MESLEGLTLETEGMVHVRGDGSDEALEGGTRQQHLDRLLIPLDFTKSDSSGLKPILLPQLIFHASFSRGGLLDDLGTLNLRVVLGGSFGLGSNFGLGHSD